MDDLDDLADIPLPGEDINNGIMADGDENEEDDPMKPTGSLLDGDNDAQQNNYDEFAMLEDAEDTEAARVYGITEAKRLSVEKSKKVPTKADIRPIIRVRKNIGFCNQFWQQTKELGF